MCEPPYKGRAECACNGPQDLYHDVIHVAVPTWNEVLRDFEHAHNPGRLLLASGVLRGSGAGSGGAGLLM